jgi:hypothetical protein
MRTMLSRFPEEIIEQYNLRAMSVDGWVYIEIIKGMHGLKCAVYWPLNFYKNAWHLLDTTLRDIHLVFGYTK